MPTIVIYLLLTSWSAAVLALGLHLGSKWTEEDLSTEDHSIPISVTVTDEQTWLYTDRQNVSLSQSQ